MEQIVFDGQQTDERILYTVVAHPTTKLISLVKIAFLAFFALTMFLLISSVVTQIQTLLTIMGLVSLIGIGLFGYWWISYVHSHTKTYITDRRVMRFEAVSPFFSAKRSLFWTEVLKSKGFSPNLIFRSLKIGSVVVEPHLTDHENVIISDVYLFEDLANYIDKILYITKSNPSEIAQLKPFVPKAKGERD